MAEWLCLDSRVAGMHGLSESVKIEEAKQTEHRERETSDGLEIGVREGVSQCTERRE